jgi:zinc protease
MLLDRNIAPEIHDAVEFDFTLPPLQRTNLANGLPIYSISAGVQEVVQVDWVVPAGIWYEPKPAVAQATAAMLKNGTLTRTAAALNDELEFYGAELKTGASNDFATVSLYTLVKHLPKLSMNWRFTR